MIAFAIMQPGENGLNVNAIDPLHVALMLGARADRSIGRPGQATNIRAESDFLSVPPLNAVHSARKDWTTSYQPAFGQSFAVSLRVEDDNCPPK
jgi:hypothetical protein